mmetsp:Transcript_2409/g.10224  ORF Transcript_2409/g.10224 Transcript_2409/m.10224 type:complete len:243 (+) Transcript_2409:717-1445(+)
MQAFRSTLKYLRWRRTTSLSPRPRPRMTPRSTPMPSRKTRGCSGTGKSAMPACSSRPSRKISRELFNRMECLARCTRRPSRRWRPSPPMPQPSASPGPAGGKARGRASRTRTRSDRSRSRARRCRPSSPPKASPSRSSRTTASRSRPSRPRRSRRSPTKPLVLGAAPRATPRFPWRCRTAPSSRRKLPRCWTWRRRTNSCRMSWRAPALAPKRRPRHWRTTTRSRPSRSSSSRRNAPACLRS